jgi:hypothetical protein
MSFPRYPNYKAGGVQWLSEVPQHWEVKRLELAPVSLDTTLSTGTEKE